MADIRNCLTLLKHINTKSPENTKLFRSLFFSSFLIYSSPCQCSLRPHEVPCLFKCLLDVDTRMQQKQPEAFLTGTSITIVSQRHRYFALMSRRKHSRRSVCTFTLHVWMKFLSKANFSSQSEKSTNLCFTCEFCIILIYCCFIMKTT